tara:strand:+ start:1686 stop:1955 length:270 start_codon:yes stop_codon:yes gene_type:complete
MKAYLITYKEVSRECIHRAWKIANSEANAIKFAFGNSRKGKETTMATKRGLKITIIEIKEHEVSEAFPITPIPKRKPTKEVSSDADWML